MKLSDSREGSKDRTPTSVSRLNLQESSETIGASAPFPSVSFSALHPRLPPTWDLTSQPLQVPCSNICSRDNRPDLTAGLRRDILRVSLPVASSLVHLSSLCLLPLLHVVAMSPSLKERISSPLEAGVSVLDGHQLPSTLIPALEYTSKRLAAKGLSHYVCGSQERHELPSPTLSSPGTSLLSSPGSPGPLDSVSAQATGTAILPHESRRGH